MAVAYPKCYNSKPHPYLRHRVLPKEIAKIAHLKYTNYSRYLNTFIIEFRFTILVS